MLLALEHPAQHLYQQAVVIMSAKNLDAFLLQIRTNATLRLLVKGILVDPVGTDSLLDMHAAVHATTVFLSVLMVSQQDCCCQQLIQRRVLYDAGRAVNAAAIKTNHFC